jgi:hypothetical protein
MNILLMTLGLSTAWLFMYKIEWLFHFKSFMIYMSYTVALFLVALLADGYWPQHEVIVVALKITLYSGLLFKVLHLAFKAMFHRNPENTFWTVSSQPVENIVFSVLFWILGVGGPVLLVL